MTPSLMNVRKYLIKTGCILFYKRHHIFVCKNLFLTNLVLILEKSEVGPILAFITLSPFSSKDWSIYIYVLCPCHTSSLNDCLNTLFLRTYFANRPKCEYIHYGHDIYKLRLMTMS
jgi:hypothetical protein